MKNRNEQEVLSRESPFAYKAQDFTNGSPAYEAWADPGALEADAIWICRYNAYDVSGNLTRSYWAKDSSNRIGTFTNVATDLSILTYV